MGEWRWPLSMIGGNHEPYQWLRGFDGQRFGPNLTYTNAGVLDHRVPGLRVCGLSGIYHPEHLKFAGTDSGARVGPKSWTDLVGLAAAHQAKLQRLTYYKQFELDILLALPRKPDLLLLHDWPIDPPRIPTLGARPERILVDRLSPRWVCSGHHHTPAEMKIGQSEFVALNIIRSRNEIHPHTISNGWAAIFSWDGGQLNKRAVWPSAVA